MSIRYEREDARRCVRLTIEGAFQKGDVLTNVAQRRIDDTWTYGTLIDLRRMIGRPALADLREIATEAAAREAGEVQRGPVAILATDPTHYNLACAYAALRKSTLIEVFRALDEAKYWLTAKLDERRGPSTNAG
jgi:hypothetical protein